MLLRSRFQLEESDSPSVKSDRHSSALIRFAVALYRSLDVHARAVRAARYVDRSGLLLLTHSILLHVFGLGQPFLTCGPRTPGSVDRFKGVRERKWGEKIAT